MVSWRAIGDQIYEEILASDAGMSATHQGVSVSSIAIFLDKLITEEASLYAMRTEKAAPLRIPYLQRFDSSQVPQISISDYIQHLRKYGRFDTSSAFIALIYIDRLLSEDPNFALTYSNVHRLILTCMTVAEKYSNDKPYINEYYARVGGVCWKELNRLEIIVINALNWRLGVSQEEYDNMQKEVRRAFVDALSASDTTERTSLEEALFAEQFKPVSPSASKASTTSGSTIFADSDTESCSDSIMDSSSEHVFDIFAY